MSGSTAIAAIAPSSPPLDFSLVEVAEDGEIVVDGDDDNSDGDDIDEFHAYMHTCNAIQIPVIRAITPQNETVALLPKIRSHHTSSAIRDVVAFPEFKCTICTQRVQKLRWLVGADWQPVLCRSAHKRSAFQDAMHTKCVQGIQQFRKKPQSSSDDDDDDMLKHWTFEIVTQQSLFPPKQDWRRAADIPDDARPFYHYTFVPEEVSASTIPQNTIKRMESACNKYIPLISALLAKVGTLSDMVDSCNALLPLLEQAAYGHHQLGATKWLLDICTRILRETSKDEEGEEGNKALEWSWVPIETQLRILGQVICASPISSAGADDDGGAHIGFFHTANNFVLDILAHGKNPQAVIKMLEKRNAPDAYRRRTGAVSEGHIRAAEAVFGNMRNTIMTTAELEALEGCVRLFQEKEEEKAEAEAATSSDASAVFAAMRKEVSKKKKATTAYGGFAARMGEGGRKQSREMEARSALTGISSVGAFVECVRKYSDLRVRVDANVYKQGYLYVAKTNIAPDDLAYGHTLGHLWAFSGKNTDGFRDSRWKTVTHVYPFSAGNTYKNVLFVVKEHDSASRIVGKGNCMFPAFLAPKHRAAERAVEELNRRTTVEIPRVGDDGSTRCGGIALGIGASHKKHQNELSSCVTLRVHFLDSSTNTPPVSVILTHF